MNYLEKQRQKQQLMQQHGDRQTDGRTDGHSRGMSAKHSWIRFVRARLVVCFHTSLEQTETLTSTLRVGSQPTQLCWFHLNVLEKSTHNSDRVAVIVEFTVNGMMVQILCNAKLCSSVTVINYNALLSMLWKAMDRFCGPFLLSYSVFVCFF